MMNLRKDRTTDGWLQLGRKVKYTWKEVVIYQNNTLFSFIAYTSIISFSLSIYHMLLASNPRPCLIEPHEMLSLKGRYDRFANPGIIFQLGFTVFCLRFSTSGADIAWMSFRLLYGYFSGVDSFNSNTQNCKFMKYSPPVRRSRELDLKSEKPLQLGYKYIIRRKENNTQRRKKTS